MSVPEWGRRRHNLILNRSTTSKRDSPEEGPQDNAGDRRRLGRIVHDDRGTASVEWLDAPADEVRTKLEIEATPSTGRGTRDPLGADALSIKTDESFDPYERATAERKASGNTTRKDLRKLSEWIKLKRAMEDKTDDGGGEEE